MPALTTPLFVTDAPFSAVGDGVTDDTAAFANAAATNRKVYVPWTPNGYNLASGCIDMPSNSSFIGENGVKLKSAASYIFGMAGNGIKVDDFSMDMTGSPAASSAIRIRTSLLNPSQIKLSNINLTNCVSSVADEATAAGFCSRVRCENIFASLTRGPQFSIGRSRGFMYFDRCTGDHTQNTTPVTWGGFVFSDYLGLNFQDCTVQGPTSAGQPAVYQPTATAFQLTGGTGAPAQLWMNRCLVDDTMSDAYLVSLCTLLGANDLRATGMLGNAMTLDYVQSSFLSNIGIVGTKGQSGALSGQAGLRFIGATGEVNNVATNNVVVTGCNNNAIEVDGDIYNVIGVALNNILANGNGYDGVYVNGSTATVADILASNIINSLNGGKGWREVGPYANRITKVNARFLTNSGGSATQVGASSAMLDYIGNSGAFGASLVGPGTIP
jgi:hypothetical protein